MTFTIPSHRTPRRIAGPALPEESDPARPNGLSLAHHDREHSPEMPALPLCNTVNISNSDLSLLTPYNLPSNSRSRGIPTGDDFGIDTVRIAFHVNLEQCDPSADLWHSTSSRILGDHQQDAETWSGRLDLDNGSIQIELRTAHNICTLEFNPARLIHGKGVALFDPDQLVALVEELIETLHSAVWPIFMRITDAGQIVWDADWPDQVQFRRIDIARNFRVAEHALVKSALPLVRSRYQKHQVVETSGGKGWCLQNKTKSVGQDRFYDKNAELLANGVIERLDQLPGNVFRFETQIKGSRRGDLGLRYLSQATRERAWEALEARWNATGWGTPLPRTGDLLEALDALSSTVKLRLIGFLHMEVAGVTEQQLKKDSIRESRAQLKRLGIVPGMPVELLGPADQALDLDLGHVVCVNQRQFDLAS